MKKYFVVFWMMALTFCVASTVWALPLHKKSHGSWDDKGYKNMQSIDNWFCKGDAEKQYGSLLSRHLRGGSLDPIVIPPKWWPCDGINLEKIILALKKLCPPKEKPPVSVPEPATILMFGAGMIGLAGLGRYQFVRRKKEDE